MKIKQYNIILLIAVLLMVQGLLAQSYEMVIVENDGTTVRKTVSDIDRVFFQETGTLTDIDGNTYKIIKIGNQWWMAENLRTSHYRDGTPIPNVADNTTWSGLSTGAYCYYFLDSISYKETYGALYNWHAVNGDTNGDGTKDKEIAPTGWRVPSDDDWKTLEMHLGMSQVDADNIGWRGIDEGTRLKSRNGWNNDGNGVDEVGFAGVPGGIRNSTDGLFSSMGYNAQFWSASEYLSFQEFGFGRSLSYFRASVSRNTETKKKGFSVRCVKDVTP